MYVSLFPQLIAGPIVRYTTIEEELENRAHTFEKFALGVNIGSLGYSSVNMEDKKSDYEITVSSFKCNLNEAQVHARFYF